MVLPPQNPLSLILRLGYHLQVIITLEKKLICII